MTGLASARPDDAGLISDDDELTLRAAETLPPERFRGACTRLERGGLHGKIVLTP